MNEAGGINAKKVRMLDLILAVMTTASGALFFLFVMRAITGVAYSTWIVPMGMAVIFVASLSLFAVTVGVKRMTVPIVIAAFLPSAIFTPIIIHISITAIAMLVAIHGLSVMRRSLFNTLKINMTTIVRSGVSYVIIAVVVAITSQYYFSVKEGVADTVFDASDYVGVTNMATDFMLSQFNIENVSVNTMTVNDFLYFLMQNAYAQEVEGPQIPVEDEGMIVRWASSMGIDLEQVEEDAEEQVVAQMRNNIASMLGREIRSDELVTDIFSEIIELQVNNAMEQNQILQDNRAGIFTSVFFVVVFSLASIVRILSNWLARFLFMLLREFKVIRIEKIQREAEVVGM